jgi:hypothetical protein
MRIFKAALVAGSYLAVAGASLSLPATVSADTVTDDQKIIIHDGDWYEAHQGDARWHWLNDPADDRGWYDRDGNWRSDPGARAVAGGAAGAGIGAAVGCVVTIAIGCAPGAAVGAAIGGGSGAVAGAASTPDHHDEPPPN